MLANVALPSFLPHSFATLIGILLIAAIEGWFVMKTLRLSYVESYRHALNANWKSTIAGIPLAWLLWVIGLIPVSLGLSVVGLEVHPVVTSTAMRTAIFGGMMPTEWMNVGSAAAWIVMLLPFWLGSVWIERRTLAKRLPDCEPFRISSAVVRGNLASYGIFLAFGVVALSSAIADLPKQKQRFKEFRERQETYRNHLGEQDGADQPVTAPESESEDNSNPKPESEVRSQ